MYKILLLISILIIGILTGCGRVNNPMLENLEKSNSETIYENNTQINYQIVRMDKNDSKVIEGYTYDFIWPVDQTDSMEYIQSYVGHKAVDVVINKGTAVRAMGSGIIVEMKNNSKEDSERNIYNNGGKGNFVTINHTAINTRYMHLAQNITVIIGNKVEKGDIIGFVANSGFTCGKDHIGSYSKSQQCKGEPGSQYHLHFEFLRGLELNNIVEPGFYDFFAEDKHNKLAKLATCNSTTNLKFIKEFC